MPVVGTAGHVDHGKSTLVEAITGRDPDRWLAEKERGLTIDLGFSWATLPSGTEVSFVDVPGHERYLKNMLAGIEMIDVALFVVAANEGWMPQSEEHLAVLDLLGVARAVIAITKTDLVDEGVLSLAREEITTQIEGTSIEGSPMIPVSAALGTGMDELVSALDDILPEATGPGTRPRLWIDRSFTVAGAGTVVTGTLLGGPLVVDDRVVVLPSGKESNVKGLQSHETPVESAQPGTRVAVNLRGIDADEIERGSMLGLPAHWQTSDRFSASVRAARYAQPVSPKGAYHLHLGSGAYPISVQGVEGGFMVARTRRRLPLTSGDRFILRDTGRRRVVAGGQVLDPDPPGLTAALRHSPALARRLTPDSRAGYLLEIRGSDSIDRLVAHTGGGRPVDAILAGDTAMSETAAVGLEERAYELVTEEHTKRPLREGIPLATLATRLRVSQSLLEAVLARTERLEVVDSHVRSPVHVASLTPAQLAGWDRARQLLSLDLAVPGVAELGLDPELIHFLTRSGELVAISSTLVLLPDQAEEIKKAISRLDDGFTVSQFGAELGVSRKYAVPMLEWADDQNVTIRRGDRRFKMGSDG